MPRARTGSLVVGGRRGGDCKQGLRLVRRFGCFNNMAGITNEWEHDQHAASRRGIWRSRYRCACYVRLAGSVVVGLTFGRVPRSLMRLRGSGGPEQSGCVAYSRASELCSHRATGGPAWGSTSVRAGAALHCTARQPWAKCSSDLLGDISAAARASFVSSVCRFPAPVRV